MAGCLLVALAAGLGCPGSSVPEDPVVDAEAPGESAGNEGGEAPSVPADVRSGGSDASGSECSRQVIEDGLVTEPPVCAEQGSLASVDNNPWGVRARWTVAASLADAATGVLADYRADGACRLAYDGALDLLGRVWGCVVVDEDDGWVEVAIVDEREGRELFDAGGETGDDDGETCAVTIVRIGQRDIASARAGDWDEKETS